MKADLLRKKFLEFFKTRKHAIVESDSLVPKDDPTVLFTPAGMNQFKKEFLGFKSGFSKAATSQRCLRTGDLEKVGKTNCHHTFFEMLGNFSFGDYFKKEAISWAWEFLTEELKIDKEKLWVSVYKDDNEAYKIWKEIIKIPTEKIVKLGDKENFWPAEAKEKGPNGPCGPCSEIFFDWGREAGCKKPDCSPACGCGRFTEVWNLVFTQFNRKDAGKLEPLPKKNIDTGMGLERLAAVMQGVKSNFETDLFKPLIDEVLSLKSEVKSKELVYAVADHVRAIVFAIYDGVLPSNEGRGYVVRKLIRKAVLHLQALGINKPFLYKLVGVLYEIMKIPYPELVVRRENIAEIILAEEKSFLATLETSETLFQEKFSSLLKNPDSSKAGKIAFQLYDTHGIPLELTQEWLHKNGIKISHEAFTKELHSQKTRSKAQSTMKGDVFNHKHSDFGVKATSFVGYKEFEVKAKVLAIMKDEAKVKKISKGEQAKIILDKTPFYPESGGQAGDTGEIIRGKNIFEVLETKKIGKVIIHIGKVKEGSFKGALQVAVKIDSQRRMDIARNHTATHLLQAALRQVLGVHVQQQGSLVDRDRLRFDFTHFKDIGNNELSRVEDLVNSFILNNHMVSPKSMSLAQAKKQGALAFFAEKYESNVRVVSICDISRELCGGTHLNCTSEIGIFKITQEGSVASGVRRIEAVTGNNAYKLIKEEEALIAQIASSLNVTKERIAPELDKVLTQRKELDKELSEKRLDFVKASVASLIEQAQFINGIKVITVVLENLDMNSLRTAVDLIKQKTENTIIALGSADHNRAFLVMGVTLDLCVKGWDAGNLISKISKLIGGSGGGRKDFAQSGGNRPQNFNQAFQELKNIITNWSA